MSQLESPPPPFPHSAPSADMSTSGRAWAPAVLGASVTVAIIKMRREGLAGGDYET